MKTICKLAMLLFLLTGVASARAAIVNVPITNGSFESPVVVGEQQIVPTGWTAGGSGQIYLYNNPAFAKDGNQVLEIYQSSSDVYQNLTTPAQAGMSYTLSLWVWGQNDNYRWAQMLLDAVDPSNPDNFVRLAQRLDLGALDWHLESVTSGPVPAAQNGWNLRVHLNGGYGWTMMDDVKLTYTAPDPSPISEVKQVTNGTSVLTSGIVVASFGSHFYIESPDRSSGIRVEGTAGFPTVVGNKANVTGYMVTRPDGEHCIAATNVTQVPDTELAPLGMNNKSTGGGNAGLQAGVDGGNGLNNIGLLVTTIGRVSTVSLGGIDRLALDDGSGVPLTAIIPAPTGLGGTPVETLIPNSSFEDPVIPVGDNWIGGVPTGWTLVSGTVDKVGIGNYYAPNPDGTTQFLAMTGVGTQVSTYALDTLVEGRTYTFTLDFRKGSVGPTGQMSAWAIRDKNDPWATGGNRWLVLSYYDLGNVGSWKEYNWSFNAPEGSNGWYVLIFLSPENQWDNFDGLKLTSVPTPAAYQRPADGSYVSVTGAMSCLTTFEGNIQRVIEITSWQEIEPALAP